MKGEWHKEEASGRSKKGDERGRGKRKCTQERQNGEARGKGTQEEKRYREGERQEGEVRGSGTRERGKGDIQGGDPRQSNERVNQEEVAQRRGKWEKQGVEAIRDRNRGRGRGKRERDIKRSRLEGDGKGRREREERKKRKKTVKIDNEAKGREKLQKVVKEKLGNKFSVNQQQKLNPRIMIRNVKLQQHTDESFAVNFISANELTDFNASDIKVVVKFKALEKDHYNIVLEVPPLLRKRLVDRGFAYFGWKRCSVGDNLYIVQCHKCMKFGHHQQNCRGSEVCSKCSGEHSVKKCVSDEMKCVNCSMYNNKYKSKLSTNHLATDNHCPMYQNYVLQLRSRINYG
nr:unnamed protein product [Callosobruchus analis]